MVLKSPPQHSEIPADSEILALIDSGAAEIRETLGLSPLTRSAAFSEKAGRDVYFKWDSKFRTGSFKERGALFFLRQLQATNSKLGVCAASAGNHALALSFHAARLGIPCTIVMPTSAPLVKVENTRLAGARVILQGDIFDEAYAFAKVLAENEGLTFVPAFDHPWTIAGQGSCGVEILEQLPNVDSVIVPIGGGGLISGIALAIKRAKPDCFILGVRSAWAAAAQERRERGEHQPLLSPSIADGIAVKRSGVITTPIIERLVDRVILQSEQQIAHGMIEFLEAERALIEGAGGAAVAGLLSAELPKHCKNTVVIACGSNVDITLLARLIQGDLARQGRIARIRVSVPDRPGSLHKLSGEISKLGANVLEVFHDRSFSEVPGMVEIAFLLELRNPEHGANLIDQLNTAGLFARAI